MENVVRGQLRPIERCKIVHGFFSLLLPTFNFFISSVIFFGPPVLVVCPFRYHKVLSTNTERPQSSLKCSHAHTVDPTTTFSTHAREGCRRGHQETVGLQSHCFVYFQTFPTMFVFSSVSTGFASTDGPLTGYDPPVPYGTETSRTVWAHTVGGVWGSPHINDGYRLFLGL